MSNAAAVLLVVAIVIFVVLTAATVGMAIAIAGNVVRKPAVVKNEPPAPQAVDVEPVQFGVGDRVLFRHDGHKCSGVVQERYGDDVRLMAHGSEQWIDAADVIRVLPSHKPAPPPQGSPTGSTGSVGAKE